MVTAWLCANLRPDTAVAALSWVQDAARFSHQQRLTLDVARLLTSERPVASVAKTEAAPKPKPQAPAAPEAPFKKLEAPLARNTFFDTRSLATAVPYFSAGSSPLGRDRAAPPHGPPRGTRVS